MNRLTHLVGQTVFCFVLCAPLATKVWALYQQRTYAPFPARKADAMTGSEFMKRHARLTALEREIAVFNEISTGNVPSFLRKLVRVDYKSYDTAGKIHNVAMWVLPDYLAIGSDSDYVRIPMTPMTAQALADQLGFSLPTTKLVDLVYRRSKVRLTPDPMTPCPAMTTSQYFLDHQRRIDGEFPTKKLGQLVAGHKKDIVITQKIARTGYSRVAIYGWHKPGGEPIQPLSLVHDVDYVDYSHGVRLVAGKVMIDGKEKTLASILSNSKLARLVSNEGVIRSKAYRYSKTLSSAHTFAGR